MEAAVSSLILYTVSEDGSVAPYKDFRNSWGGAALIWDYFTEKYFPLKPNQKTWDRTVGMFADMKPIWDLQHREDLSDAEYGVLMSTFDNVMVRREDLIDLAECFDVVAADMPKYLANGRCNHMADQAATFREIAIDPKVLAVCWQQTTVAEDMWYVYLPEASDESEDGEGLPGSGSWYNINTGTKHWFLFDTEEKDDNK